MADFLTAVMDVLAGILGVKKTAIVVAFISAVCSLKFVPDMKTWTEKLLMTLSGFFFTVYVSPMIAEQFMFKERTEAGITFLLGLFGMSLAAAVITVISSGQLWEFIRSRYGRQQHNDCDVPVNPLKPAAAEEDK